MKTLISFSLFLLSFFQIAAQGAMYNELVHYGQYFYDVDADNTSVTAAGDNIIIHSNDNGNTWEEIYLPKNNAKIKHVSRVSEGHYVAAGTYLHVTKDNGKSWIDQEEMTDIQSMENFGSTIIVTRNVAGERFMRSDDGGLSWVILSTSNVEEPSALDYINTDDAYFSDQEGNIYYSFNGGLSWTKINESSFSEAIESIRFISKEEGYVQIGDLVWHTEDSGVSWNQIIDSFIASGGVYPLPSGLYTNSSTRFGIFNGTGLSYILQDEEIDDIFSLDLAEGNGYLYNSGTGSVFRHNLNDSFEEWDDITPGPNDGFNAMEIKANKIFATGGRRMILSNDLLETYQSEETSFSQVKDIAISADGTLYITQNTLKKSTNDGKDWEFLAASTTLVHVFEDGRLLTFGSGKINQSTDGGLTFESIFDTQSGLAYDIYFVDENFGWLLNSSQNAFRTTDGGLTWEAITFPFGASPSKMHFIDDQIGFGVKQWTDKFWKTIDGGITWEEIEFTGGEGDFTDVYFEDELIGYVVGRFDTSGEAVVYQTLDGGESWEILQRGIGAYYSITNDQSGRIWVCGERGQLLSFKACSDLIPTLQQTNDRISCDQNSEFYKWYLNGNFLVETTEAYIDVVQPGEYSVRILGEDNCTSQDSEGLAILSDVNETINEQFVKIYPNPSSGQISLEVDPSYHFESITIYSLAGQKVLSKFGMINELNLSTLPRGSYFVRLQMSEGVVCKRIMLE